MAVTMNTKQLLQIRKKLEDVERDFDRSREIQNDPVSEIFAYGEPLDKEVAAFIAAVFSYGNVKQIQRTLGVVFSLLGDSPAKKLRSSSGSYWKKTIPSSFKHRFNTAEDLGCLLTWLGEALRIEPSLELFFVNSQPQKKITDVASALENFIDRMTRLPSAPFIPPPTKGVHFFLTRPSGKSACKRLLLFLRWVAGSGPMDLHLWKDFPKEMLLIPVDTHVLRIAKHLGFTKRKDNSWKTAEEITEVLKLMDPRDPARFDFALCHLGISQECPSRFNKRVCPQCRMNDVCVTYAKTKR
jgi:uncharacterized protein (TIGR02757 family)